MTAGEPERLWPGFAGLELASNRQLYSRGFQTIFGKYQTTTPAREGVMRSYLQTALIPWPKAPVLFVIEGRGEYNLLVPLFAARIDPADVNIIRGRLQDASTMVAGPLLVFGIGESEGQAGGAGVATVRPGSITVALIPPVTSARNVWQGTVTTLVAMPHAIRIRVDLGEVEVAADVTAESAARMRLAPGVGVWLSAKAQEVVITSDPGDTQSTV